jgi:hypothetical protein
MSCYGQTCYLPRPTRVWSRVQNSCSLITNIDSNGIVKIPLTNEIVPASLLYDKVQMLKKGNILQYKANSTNLSKAQKYSLITKKLWVNRNTTWATQSTKGYTNPNSTSLKRTGNVVNIKINNTNGTIIGPTFDPITCIKPYNPTYNNLPSIIIGQANGSPNPPNPVVISPSLASESFPTLQPVINQETTTVIQDGGSLVCSIMVNECTGYENKNQAQQLCHPTSDSDVPGQIIDLCWNDGIKTWYPRQQSTMSNSGNKWPYSSGGNGLDNFVYDSAIKPTAPIITTITTNNNIVSLTWQQPISCIPIKNYEIFQNNIPIKRIPSNTFSTIITINLFESYSFFIIANTNGNVKSDPSNVVNTISNFIEPPSNLFATINKSQRRPSIEFTWDNINLDTNPLATEISYNVYLNNNLYLTDVTSPFVFEYLEKDKTYTIGVQTSILVPETDLISNSIIKNIIVEISY